MRNYRGRSEAPYSMRAPRRTRWHVLAWLLAASCPMTVCAETPSASTAAPADASSVPRPAADQPTDPFAKGSRYGSVLAAASRKPALAWFALTQLTIHYYLVDDLAMIAGGQVGYVESQRTTGGAFGGPELGLRWHVAKNARWSVYVDALAGAMYQQHAITPASLRFNFDLQGGAGATYRVSRNTLCAGGVRSHHLSNARVRGKNRNMGYDAVMLYLELLQTF